MCKERERTSKIVRHLFAVSYHSRDLFPYMETSSLLMYLEKLKDMLKSIYMYLFLMFLGNCHILYSDLKLCGEDCNLLILQEITVFDFVGKNPRTIKDFFECVLTLKLCNF